MFASIAAGKKRAIGSQGDDHASNAAGQQFRSALFCVFNIFHRGASNRFRFTLVGDEVVEIFQRIQVDRLRGRGVQNATDSVLARKLDRVIHRFQRNLELQHDAIGGLQRLRGGIYVGGLERVVRPFHD